MKFRIDCSYKEARAFARCFIGSSVYNPDGAKLIGIDDENLCAVLSTDDGYLDVQILHIPYYGPIFRFNRHEAIRNQIPLLDQITLIDHEFGYIHSENEFGFSITDVIPVEEILLDLKRIKIFGVECK